MQCFDSSRMLLLLCALAMAACSPGETDTPSQTSAAEPDPFVGEYLFPRERYIFLRMTRQDGRYFGALRRSGDDPFMPAMGEVDCPQYVHRDLDEMREVDPVVVCIATPEEVEGEMVLLLHTRATTEVPDLDMRTTGYFFELVLEDIPAIGHTGDEVQRTGPEAEAYARFQAEARAAARREIADAARAATAARGTTGIFGGPDCYWDRMEFRDDQTVGLTDSRFGSNEGEFYTLPDGNLAIDSDGQTYYMTPLPDGALRGVQWVLGTCVPIR